MKKEQEINLEEERTVVEQQNGSMPETGKSGVWKNVIIGGVPGVILGTAGTVFAQEVINTNNPENQEEESSNTDYVAPQVTGVAMAESVNDDMSFGEAFAAARAEVGPGGAFEWHGNLYNTYSAAEWEAMSDEDRQTFANSVFNVQSNEDKPAEESQEQNQEQNPTETPVSNDGEGAGEAADVQIQQVGTYVSDEGEIVNVAIASVNDHDAAFIDENNDGYIDSIMVDANDNGVIEDSEVIETPNSDLNMSQLTAVAESSDGPIYDGTPDYTNDADTSSL